VRFLVFPSLSLNIPSGNLKLNGSPGTEGGMVKFLITTGRGSITGVGVTNGVNRATVAGETMGLNVTVGVNVAVGDTLLIGKVTDGVPDTVLVMP
jgi:hypothetical protein